jgi:hypothetical protein
MSFGLIKNKKKVKILIKNRSQKLYNSWFKMNSKMNEAINNLYTKNIILCENDKGNYLF